jgi:hypothetical protein
LFHFLLELCDCVEKFRNNARSVITQLDHLTLLINRIKDTNLTTKQRLALLLRHGQIIYNFLWAFSSLDRLVYQMFRK